MQQPRHDTARRRGSLVLASLLAAAAALGMVGATALLGHTRGASLASTAPGRHGLGDPYKVTSILVDGGDPLGTISQSVIGSDFLAADDGMGSFDAATGSFYQSFLRLLSSDVYVGSLRFPGGTTAQSYQWERAIGPQSHRRPNAAGPANGPSASTVGPDEFGQLLTRTGAQGVVTVNFDTGDAAQAAALVEYLTGKPGSSYWADLRVRYGHRAPYDVPYFEVGNEAYAKTGWRRGKPVSVGGPPGACQSVATCEYIYGGSTRFTKERVVRFANRTPAAAASNGRGAQAFYVAFAPVRPGSATVFVAGRAWHEVQSLSAAGPGSDVYILDTRTGEIRFGNGVHGAVPPKGALVTASYVSGPHDGFLRFYAEMKRANPNIQVCATDPRSDFIDAMGSTLPYDCMQLHLYVTHRQIGSLQQYERDVMVQPTLEYQKAQGLQQELLARAGWSVPLVVTEYGTGLTSTPVRTIAPYYLDSLDEALVNASQLIDWIELGIPVADRQLLTAELPPPAHVGLGLPGAAPYATTGAIATLGAGMMAEPTGRYLGLFRPFAGANLFVTSIFGNPVLATSAGASTGDLSAVGASDGSSAYVLVVNRNPDSSVPAQLSVVGFGTGPTATLTTLDGPGPLSYNSPAHPNLVGTRTSEVTVSGGSVQMTFPAHSITLVQFAPGA